MSHGRHRRSKAGLFCFSCGDIEGFAKDFDPPIVSIEFEGSPNAGAYSGIDDVKAHVAKGRSAWAEGSCEPERFVAAGDKVVVVAHVNVRLKGRKDWLEGRTGDVFTFHNGRVIEFRTFWKPKKLLRGSTLKIAASHRSTFQ